VGVDRPAELQLCWLVYIIGSIVGQHGIGATSADSEKNDGDLTAAALQLSKVPPPFPLPDGGL